MSDAATVGTEAGSKARKPPVVHRIWRPVSQGSLQGEQHRGAAHVAALAQHLSAGMKNSQASSCVAYGGAGGDQTSEKGLHVFAPGLNRMMAAIRNQRARSTETVTRSSCRNKVLSSLSLKPRRMESRASCHTPVGAPVPARSGLAAREAHGERRRSLISTLWITKPRSF